MLSPKRTKYRKVQKGSSKGRAMRGNKVVDGDYGIQALEPAWITANQNISVGMCCGGTHTTLNSIGRST